MTAPERWRAPDPDDTADLKVSLGPEQLPPVPPEAIAQAWSAASAYALGCSGAAIGPDLTIAFRRRDGGVQRLVLTDRDARVWMAALDRSVGLDSLAGLSTALRLLALVQLLCADPRFRRFIDLEPPVEMHPRLLRAAARLTLTEAGTFSADRLAEELGLRR